MGGKMIMVLFLMLGVAIVLAPLHYKDNVDIHAYGVVNKVSVTVNECVFRGESNLENSVYQNGTWKYIFSESYVPDPGDCLNTSINVMPQLMDNKMIPFIYASSQILNNIDIELIDLSWLGESNQSPSTHPTTVGRQMKDEGTYGYLTDTTYTTVTNGEAGRKAEEVIYASSVESDGHNVTEIKCNFRLHVELENVFILDGTKHYNISERYIPDPPECLRTRITVHTFIFPEFKENLTQDSIFNSPRKNGRRNGLSGMLQNVTFEIVQKTIEERMMEQGYGHLMGKSTYITVTPGRKYEPVTIIHALNVEGVQQQFDETKCSFRADLKLENPFSQYGFSMFNISRRYIPDPPDCLNASINVMTLSGNKTIPFIYKYTQNISELSELSELNKNKKFHGFTKKTIEMQIKDEGTYARLTMTTYATVTKEEAQLMNLLEPEEPQENAFSLSSVLYNKWFIGVMILILMIIVIFFIPSSKLPKRRFWARPANKNNRRAEQRMLNQNDVEMDVILPEL